MEAKSSELAEALGSGEEARVAEACDGAAVSLQQEWGLSNDAVAAVRRLGSAAKKAGRLAGALRRQGGVACCPASCLPASPAWFTCRQKPTTCKDSSRSAARCIRKAAIPCPCPHGCSTQFMQRLQHDLSTREGRLRELQDK